MTRAQQQESSRKCLSPNRDLAQLMSRMTVGGRVPTWPEVLAAQAAEYERTEIMDASERSTCEGVWQ